MVFHSFDQVKVYIQSYLKNLEENLLSPEDGTQLYLLFVNCFQVKDVPAVIRRFFFLSSTGVSFDVTLYCWYWSMTLFLTGLTVVLGSKGTGE